MHIGAVNPVDALLPKAGTAETIDRSAGEILIAFRETHKREGAKMGDKGKKDKGKRKEQKKSKQTLKEKRRQKNDKATTIK